MMVNRGSIRWVSEKRAWQQPLALWQYPCEATQNLDNWNGLRTVSLLAISQLYSTLTGVMFLNLFLNINFENVKITEICEEGINNHPFLTHHIFISFFFFVFFFFQHPLTIYYVAGTVLGDTKMTVTDILSQPQRKEVFKWWQYLS